MSFCVRAKASSWNFRTAFAGLAAIVISHFALPVPFATASLAPAQQRDFSLFQASSIRFSTQKLAGLVQLAKNDATVEICSTAQHRNCDMWNVVVDHMEDADVYTRVRWINYAVNTLISYKTDRHTDDDWKSGSETLQSMTGDCEDYALLKMKLLNASGIPASQMAVVVVEGAWINTHHAVLAVNLGGRMWILDNLLDDVALDTSIPDYQPLYAFNSEGSWLYGNNPIRNLSVKKEAVAERGGAFLDERQVPSRP